MRSKTRRAAWSLAVSLLAPTGCTSTESSPAGLPGPPDTCTQVTALAGCVGNALSYSCTSGRPDDGNADLVCDRGVAGIGGASGAATMLYCCAPYGQQASDCAPATVTGCGAQSFGFACAGAASPDQVDPSLVCSAAVAQTGMTTEYCCVPFDATSAVCRCASFDDDAGLCGVAPAGCAGAAVGFACAAGHTPAEVNPLLTCTGGGAGTTADGGGGQASGNYCCTTP